MKILLIAVLAASGGLALADQSSFVQAYDAGKFDEAAKQIDGLDTSHAGVARRLGVMYYNGKGVDGDQAKGRTLLEQAMMAGDATAAVNLAKIYFKVEKNSPKAAWCLMVAEGLKDASVKDDVAKLRGYLGDDYLKGVASYIAQLRDLLASEQLALKNKTAESERERTSLTKQITSCQDEAKKKDEAFAREREELTAAKADLGKKLTTAEETVAADKKKIDELTAKLAEASSDRSALDKLKEECEDSKKKHAIQSEEVEKLKKELAETAAEAKKTGEELAAANKKNQEVLDKYNALVASSNQKVSNAENALAEAKTAAEESNKKYKEMLTKYNKLVDKYNDLVRKYNRMLKIYKDGSAMIKGYDPEGDEIDVDDETELAEDEKKDPNADWFGRGWNTFFCAPCNFVRTIPATGELYDSALKSTSGGYAFFVAAISTPVVFCCEIVPTVCDLGNGLADMISLGAYGNWLYSGSIESRWYKRDDSHFPWLDRE